MSREEFVEPRMHTQQLADQLAHACGPVLLDAQLPAFELLLHAEQDVGHHPRLIRRRRRGEPREDGQVMKVLGRVAVDLDLAQHPADHDGMIVLKHREQAARFDVLDPIGRGEVGQNVFDHAA